MNDIHRNEAELEGLVQTPPAYSHENHGKPFYRCLLEVPRLSGQADLLPLLLPEELRSAAVPGERLRLQGQLRSYNNRGGQGSRLVLSTHALALSPPTGENRNRILLQGVLCKDPTYRRTPLGRSICFGSFLCCNTCVPLRSHFIQLLCRHHSLFVEILDALI